MSTIETIEFEDGDTGDRAAVIVRPANTHVGLALTLENDGDIEVFLPRAACERLISALQDRLAAIREEP